MFEYKPEKCSDTTIISTNGQPLGYHELGSLNGDFEAFLPEPKYSWSSQSGIRIKPKGEDKSAWEIVKPKTAPPVGRLPEMIEKVLKQTWKFSEPSAAAARGNHFIGTRGMPQSLANVAYGGQTYHPQVRPGSTLIPTTLGNKDAIASDWKIFNQIPRTNAVTFRGDKRTPREVIQQYGGFSPPNTRTDRYYLEHSIYTEFRDYLKLRYNRPLTNADFLKAVDAATPSPQEKSLLVDYLMWRQIMESESMHLGRMIQSEVLKGYTSTSQRLDTSVQFATTAGSGGWIYITIVQGGFVIPLGKENLWGNDEGEIAQWGPIPAERIVGFGHFSNIPGHGIGLDSPIFFRRSFRKREPEAFKKMFKMMSGKTPFMK